jgi:hypothetical protein
MREATAVTHEVPRRTAFKPSVNMAVYCALGPLLKLVFTDVYQCSRLLFFVSLVTFVGKLLFGGLVAGKSEFALSLSA